MNSKTKTVLNNDTYNWIVELPALDWEEIKKIWMEAVAPVTDIQATVTWGAVDEPERHTFSNEEIADVLEGAAELIYQGWIQRAERHDRGGKGFSYCAIGAVREKTWGFSDTLQTARGSRLVHLYDAVTMALNDAVANRFPIFRDVVSWNDAPSRRQDEVVDLFKSVAKDLRNQS